MARRRDFDAVGDHRRMKAGEFAWEALTFFCLPIETILAVQTARYIRELHGNQESIIDGQSSIPPKPILPLGRNDV